MSEKKCQIECQMKCQIECQIESSNICETESMLTILPMGIAHILRFAASAKIVNIVIAVQRKLRSIERRLVQINQRT